MTIDMCYGGCGGIWFDAGELEAVSPRAAATLHDIWHVPIETIHFETLRMCPRCENVGLERRYYSELKRVDVDQCPQCLGIWLDAGKFSHIYEESGGAQLNSSLWAQAKADASSSVGGER